MKSILSILTLLTLNVVAAMGQTCNYTVAASPDTMLCQPGTVQLQTLISGSLPSVATYLWSPATGLSNVNIPNPTATVSSTANYTVQVNALDNVNIITNGDFESGATGFTTAYAVGTGGTYGLLSTDGTYAISTNPNLTHVNFASCNDHTPAPGANMMVVNGSQAANTNIWCQTVSVTPNTTYVFGMWGITAVSTNPANLRVRFNNVAANNTFLFPTTTCSWQPYTTSWFSGSSTSLTICISNIQLAGSGNDFAIDDITLFEICQKSANVTVAISSIPVTTVDTFICKGDSLLLSGNMQTTSGTYYDTLATTTGCDSIIATQLDVRQPPKPQLGMDTTLCGSDEFILTAPSDTTLTFLWNDNSTDSLLAITSANTYTLQVMDGDSCVNSDTISILYNPYPVVNLGNDTTLCLGDERVLRATQSQGTPSYIWHDGSTSSTYVVQEPGGVYAVEVTLDNCSATDEIEIDYDVCSCNVGVPNAITPNNDGRNDIFHPLYEMGCIFNSYNMKVFNRWGKLVFQSSDINNGWDGTINGKLQPQESYLYVIEYTLDAKFNEPPVRKSGTFLLIR